MKKNIVLIAGTKHTRETIHEQLSSYLEDIVNINSCSIDEGMEDISEADLVIISTILIYDDAVKWLKNNCPVIIARRCLNYSCIEKILNIEAGKEVLFVNDCRETAEDCIDWLNRIGLNFVKYIPHYPDCPNYPSNIKQAITPGEADIVPDYIEEIIDIGPRIIDMTTISEILKELDIFEEKWNYISEKYMGKIIDLAVKLADITREKSKAYEHIKMVMDGVKEGILAVNKNYEITVFNENLRFILGVKKKNLLGKNIKEVIRDNGVLDFLLNIQEDNSKAFEIMGSKIIVNRFIIKKDQTIIATFKNTIESLGEEKLLIKELYNKGFYAKYTFDDIIGTSSQIMNTKDIALKLAKTDLNVLIQGESGTGKELFASSLHNASNRKNRPFVAVNFSALSENLVESELFGYEEGAFTGAAKGGKAGLFEQADGGTIFLDEIGDISKKVQTRLLRVLQEKEIMRVGGNKIIPIDVRIIAATNQNLGELVKEGTFRSDLYHRLKVLYLNIPPLRTRREDILTLINSFLVEKGIENITIHNKVMDKLLGYDWMGNVRELKNVMDYMIAVRKDSTITLEDLPQENFFLENEISYEEKTDSLLIREDMLFILREIYKYNKKGEVCGRGKIARAALENGLNLTEQMIRYRIGELEQEGLIAVGKGKKGTTLTREGCNIIKNIIC